MFVEALAEGLVWNVRSILATLIVVWVCFCKLTHGFLELFSLLQYFVWSVVLVYLGGNGFPYVVYIVITEPHAVYTHCVAWVVHGELQELLLHHIAVALHNGTVCHVCNGCNRIIGYALTTFCLFQRGTETAALMVEIAVNLITRCRIEATQRDIVFIHAAYLVIAALAQQSCLVGLLQCCLRAGVGACPQFINIMVVLEV